MTHARLLLGMTLLLAAISCGGDGIESPPAGSCKTGGTATGSFVASSNDCGRQNCNKELSDKAGSGWASQYFGGDGACAAFNGCLCTCLASGANPLTCGTTMCAAKLDAACSVAIQTAQACLNAHCADSCK